VTARRILAVVIDARTDPPHLTHAHHDLAALTAQAGILSPFEQARCARMLQPEARDLRIAAHVLKRLALAAPLGVAARDIAFVEPSDRPRLARPHARLSVSLSHSRAAVAVAFATAPVGVDIETPGRSRDEAALARRYFHDEEFDDAAYNNGFVWRWTAKEALKKAADIPLFEALALPMPPFASRFTAHGARFNVWTVGDCTCSLARMM
jgi:phosphopantetheinyl transferase (holo-ACP synthase)